MKQNENTIAPIDLKRSMQIKFHDHSWLFHLSLKKKKTGRCREVILAVGDTRLSGRCRCREVDISGGLTVYIKGEHLKV